MYTFILSGFRALFLNLSLLFLQDFQLQQLERRITRMQGERTNEEKLQLEARIKVKFTSVECATMNVSYGAAT